MKNKTINALIEMGMPAGINGFDYIVDAMCLFEEDNAWKHKISALYWKISQIYGVSEGSVERCIRHAFSVLLTKGNQKAVRKYLGNQNPVNSNLLSILYIKLSQEE